MTKQQIEAAAAAAVAETLNLYSVTSLIKLAFGTSEGLVQWGRGEVAGAAYDRFDILSAYLRDGDRAGAIKFLKDAPFQSSAKAAARGTDVHKVAEALALGQDVDVDDAVRPYVDRYREFLDEFEPEFVMAEAPVYNTTYGYGGTCDGIMVIDGKRLVFDLKTTAHAPDSGKSRPPFPEVALQLCFYRRAELVGLLAEQRYASGRRYYVFNPGADHEPMPETDGAICIVISPYDCYATPVRTDDEVWKHCRHAIENARWQVHTSRHVFGPQISARAKASS